MQLSGFAVKTRGIGQYAGPGGRRSTTGSRQQWLGCVTVQRLDRTWHAYRIGDPNGRYPIFDATGSTVAPGRWNDPNTPVIYASAHYSTAMLEKLVHLNGMMPPNQHFIDIELAKGLTYTRVTKDTLPGWAAANQSAARNHGVRWANACESVLLIVPSVVARMELNIVANPNHEQFDQIRTSLHQPIWWDRRLFDPPN